ncbi:PP2C family protein-serine/threonine phosphatase [Photobacterium lutimaris]|uniref:Serine/threonine-protein phosphatase n=1 Tax=Photobacterium lutimaris TaxID=388278 RepID=A0A2T3J0D3_9GAMM|nr:protein phosphatase 2C domain-containing protein [Photobacterium lutimaris]PSU34411.1 serine/threonine-protein phosphatase [Photobacterium lutimaris]
MNWRFLTFVQSHPGKVRPYNEDACLECADEGVWVVADGMGGHKAGDVASKILIEIIQEYVRGATALTWGIDYLRQAIAKANSRIYDYSQQYLNGETIGTTVVLLLVQDGLYHCLWVGDSRMYLLRSNQLSQKTRDHSQVMDMVEQGLIDKAEAENHPMANVITRAVGVEPNVTVDQVSGELVWGDIFLLCTDGLNKELSDHLIAQCMQANSVTDSGLALMHSALVKGGSDNITCALVQLTRSEMDYQGAVCSDDTVPVFHKRSNSY